MSASFSMACRKREWNRVQSAENGAILHKLDGPNFQIKEVFSISDFCDFMTEQTEY